MVIILKRPFAWQPRVDEEVCNGLDAAARGARRARACALQTRACGRPSCAAAALAAGCVVGRAQRQAGGGLRSCLGALGSCDRAFMFLA